MQEKKTLSDIMKEYDLSQSDLISRFNIPYRTVKHWVDGDRKCPGYVLGMMKMILENDIIK